MDDDQKELAKIAAQEAMKPFADLFQKLFGGPAEEIGGMMQDSLKVRRFRRQLKLLEKVQQITDDAKFEPQRVPDYIAFPVMNDATLNDDPTLEEMWASLLANASKPDVGATLSPMFPKILANLTPRQAQFLDLYFDISVYQIFVKIRPIAPDVISKHSRMSDEALSNSIGQRGFRWHWPDEKKFCIDSLVSMGVLRVEQELDKTAYKAIAGRVFAEAEVPTKRRLEPNVMVLQENFYQITVLGAEFVIACRPPNKRP
jgi:hypothetical protein